MNVLISIILVLLAVIHIGAVSPNWEQLKVLKLKKNYIINGEEAIPHSAPYIVMFTEYLTEDASTFSFCGGSIIDKSWFVTAGHCIHNAYLGEVFAGLHERLYPSETTQIRQVDFAKRHELYVGDVAPHDIGLVHVSEPFVFNEFIHPINLPFSDETHSGKVNFYGWGRVDPYHRGYPHTLQTVGTEIVDFKVCRELWGPKVHWNNICSSSLSRHISICNGDSGGPLVKEYENGTTVLVGIANWSEDICGKLNMPSVYVRVSAYIEWISQVKEEYNQSKRWDLLKNSDN